MTNKKTLYHFILDKSGSMGNCRKETVQGFNSQLEMIQKLQLEFPEQEFSLSLTVFDHFADHLYDQIPAEKMWMLSLSDYSPNGQTALLDAIGESINKIRIKNESLILTNQMSVVVVILTDGQENASRTFNYHQIASLISELEATEKWTFTFLGADIDAMHTSKMINIRKENVMSFDKSEMGEVMNEISHSLRYYASSKASGNIKKDLLDRIEKKDRRK